MKRRRLSNRNEIMAKGFSHVAASARGEGREEAAANEIHHYRAPKVKKRRVARGIGDQLSM